MADFSFGSEREDFGGFGAENSEGLGLGQKQKDYIGRVCSLGITQNPQVTDSNDTFLSNISQIKR